MSTQKFDNLPVNIPSRSRQRWIAGIALMALGLVSLVVPLIELSGWKLMSIGDETLGLLVLPALALIFLAWGLAARAFGLLIPGGMLAGIGLGAFLLEVPLKAVQNNDSSAGIFMLCFAAGWALISLLSFFTGKFHWWPFIPGAALALIGGALIVGSEALQVISLVSLAWPVVLVILGAYLLLKARATR
jgi:hypothetical protein